MTQAMNNGSYTRDPNEQKTTLLPSHLHRHSNYMDWLLRITHLKLRSYIRNEVYTAHTQLVPLHLHMVAFQWMQWPACGPARSNSGPETLSNYHCPSYSARHLFTEHYVASYTRQCKTRFLSARHLTVDTTRAHTRATQPRPTGQRYMSLYLTSRILKMVGLFEEKYDKGSFS